MVVLNLSERPNFIRTELLLHPIIPKSLSGINPRRIKGKAWWDTTRKAAYARNNYCCWSCGTHRLDTEKQLLDGHETYSYDFKKRIIRYTGTVALCRGCHFFIHFNQMTQRLSSRARTLMRGLKVLKDAGIREPYPQVLALAYLGYVRRPWRTPKGEKDRQRSLGFTYWQLEFDGKLRDILGEIK